MRINIQTGTHEMFNKKKKKKSNKIYSLAYCAIRLLLWKNIKQQFQQYIHLYKGYQNCILCFIAFSYIYESYGYMDILECIYFTFCIYKNISAIGKPISHFILQHTALVQNKLDAYLIRMNSNLLWYAERMSLII